MIETTAVKPKVLDIGAGTGLFSSFLLKGIPNAKLTLIDISEGMLDVAKKRFKDVSKALEKQDRGEWTSNRKNTVCLLQESSPMATSIGLRYLSKLDNNDRAQKMIARAVEYLENTFDSNRKGWYSVSRNVNKYPHAPWWEFRSDLNMTVIDYSWGNPTAELIGYLFKYKEYLSKLDIYSLISHAITHLNECKEFKSEHEIYCYICMYNTVNKEFSSKIEEVLKLAVSQLINTNESEWINYVPSPLKFIQLDSKNFFGIESKFIDCNLNYLIDRLEEDGRILPTWKWDAFLEEWEISKIEWMGILTLESLLSLHMFNRM